MDIAQAIRDRRATRAFLDQAIDEDTIRSILELARWAPSGVNSQPWQVTVVSGSTKKQITESLLAARQSGQDAQPDYQYYPKQWHEPYRGRRIACGKALYAALGISKEDKDRQMQAWYNNYHFFGAPVALFFWIDRDMEKGSWLDIGMFIQNVMLAAREKGLETCPQASLAEYPDIVRNILGVDNQYHLVCGMALGVADTNAAVNQYRLPREDVDSFTRWVD